MVELLDYMQAHRLLDKYKIRSAKSAYVKNSEEAIKFARGKPLVLKVISNKAIHKSRNGLIALNLNTEGGIKSAYDLLAKRAKKFRPYKVLAQHMVKNGLEVIIGGSVDQQFGKLILLGLGGIYVETFKDFAMRVCPISGYDATSMLHQLKSSKIIAPDAHMEKMIEELLHKASKMFSENSMQELDLNPIIIYDNQYAAVDIRIIR